MASSSEYSSGSDSEYDSSDPETSTWETDSEADIDELVGEAIFDEIIGQSVIGPRMKSKKSKKKKKAKKKKSSSSSPSGDSKEGSKGGLKSALKKKGTSLKRRARSAKNSAQKKVTGLERKAREKFDSAKESVQKKASDFKSKFKRRKTDDSAASSSSTSSKDKTKKKKKAGEKDDAEESGPDAKKKQKQKKKGEEEDEKDAAQQKKKKAGEKDDAEKKEGDEKDAAQKKKKKKDKGEDEKDKEKKARPDIDAPDLPGTGGASSEGGGGGGSLSGGVSGGGGGGGAGALSSSVPLQAEEAQNDEEEVEPEKPAVEQKRRAAEARAAQEEERKFQMELYRERVRLEQEQAALRAQRSAAQRALAVAVSQPQIKKAQNQIEQADEQLASLQEEEKEVEEAAEEQGYDLNNIDGGEQEAPRTISPRANSSPFYAEDPDNRIFGEAGYDETQDPEKMVKEIEEAERAKELSEDELEEKFEGGGELDSEEEDKADWQLKPASQVLDSDPRKGKRNFFQKVSEEPDGLPNALRDAATAVSNNPRYGQPAKVEENDPRLLQTLSDAYPDANLFGLSDNSVFVKTGAKPKPKRTFSFSGWLRKAFIDESDTGDGSLEVATANFGEWDERAPAAAFAATRIGAGADVPQTAVVPTERLWTSSSRSPRWIPTVNVDAYQVLALLFAAHERFARDQDNTSKQALLEVIPMQFWRTMEAVPGVSQARANAAYDFFRLLAILLVRSVTSRDNPNYKEQYKRAAAKAIRELASLIGVRDMPQFEGVKQGKELLLRLALPLLRPEGVPLIRDKTPTSWTLERVMEDLAKRVDHVAMMEDPEAARHELDRAVSMLDGVRTTTFYERLGPEKGEQFLDLLLGWARNFGEAALDLRAPDKRQMAMLAARKVYDWLEGEDRDMAVLWHSYIRQLASGAQKKEGASQYDNLRVIGRTLDPYGGAKPALPAPVPPLHMDPAKLPSPQEYQRATDVLALAHDRVPEGRAVEDLARSLDKEDTTIPAPSAPTALSLVKGDKEMREAADALRGSLDPRCFLVYWCANRTKYGTAISRLHKTAGDAWIWLRFDAPPRVWGDLRASLLEAAAESKQRALPRPSPMAVLAAKLAPLLCEGFTSRSLRTDDVSFHAECCKDPSQFMARVRRAVEDEGPLRREFFNDLCTARYYLARSIWLLDAPAKNFDCKRHYEEIEERLVRAISSCRDAEERAVLKKFFHLVLIRNKHSSPAHAALSLVHHCAKKEEEEPEVAPHFVFFDDSFEACF